MRYAKCSRDGCNNKAEWLVGRQQFCDACIGTVAMPIGEGSEMMSPYGRPARVGQKFLLRYDESFGLVDRIKEE